jgi:hypothetical protein
VGARGSCGNPPATATGPSNPPVTSNPGPATRTQVGFEVQSRKPPRFSNSPVFVGLLQVSEGCTTRDLNPRASPCAWRMPAPGAPPPPPPPPPLPPPGTHTPTHPHTHTAPHHTPSHTITTPPQPTHARANYRAPCRSSRHTYWVYSCMSLCHIPGVGCVADACASDIRVSSFCLYLHLPRSSDRRRWYNWYDSRRLRQCCRRSQGCHHQERLRQ